MNQCTSYVWLSRELSQAVHAILAGDVPADEGLEALQRRDVRLEVIETVLGHVAGSRAGIVGVYQRHRFEAETREALALWAEHVAGLTARL